jgi:LCP family protein required for cell wall assembly
MTDAPAPEEHPSEVGVAAPRSGRRFVVLRVLGGASVVAVFAVAVLAGMVLAVDGSLTRVEVDGLAGGPGSDLTEDEASILPVSGDAPADHPDPVTVLLLASDSREVLTPEERIELGTGMAWGERTEVVALLRLDADAGELRLVNIPRDTVLPLCDGSQGRVNAAFGIGERSGVGGISCVVQTVSAWSGVPIDHAVLADFRGFVDIVDALGGIEMYLEEALFDRRANLDLQAGCQILDGADALAFARARSIDSDFGRISRQQRLLVELRDQLRENGILTDPVRTLRVAEATASSLRIDRSLTLNRIRQLTGDHRSTLLQPLEARTVPGTPDTSGEAWLLRPDEEAAAELFTWLMEGDPQPTEAPESTVAGEGDTDPRDREPREDRGGSDGPTPDTDDPEEDDLPIGAQPQRCP